MDRRLNRARYDADAAVAAFAGRLQDAVDLDKVRDDLLTVVHGALQPDQLWVYVRDAEAAPGSGAVAGRAGVGGPGPVARAAGRLAAGRARPGADRGLGRADRDHGSLTASSDGAVLALAFVFLAVGFLVAVRQQANPIGWCSSRPG